MQKLIIVAALCVASSPAFAQGKSPQISTTGTLRPAAPAEAVNTNASPVPTASATQTPLQVPAPPAANAVLRTGTDVPLRLLDELTTKEKALHVGQRFHLETTESITVQGLTVIPTGTPAEGEITDVRNKGMWGKSGRFRARLLFLDLNGRRIRLSGTFDDKGHAGGALAGTVSAIAFLPAGFFMTGTSAHLAAGTPVKGYIDEDVPLNLPAVPQSAVLTIPAQPASAPLSVSPPAPTAASSSTSIDATKAVVAAKN